MGNHNHIAPRAKKDGELRMYFISMRHLSGIQKGIQAIHASAVFANEHGHLDTWKKWSTVDHTVVVLEGNVYNENGPTDLYNVFYFLKLLEASGVPYSTFTEPDLSDAFTSVAFILDERFFKNKDYPDKEEPFYEEEEELEEFYEKYAGIITQASKEETYEAGYNVFSIRKAVAEFKLASN